jgi:SET domain-containing protein 6
MSYNDAILTEPGPSSQTVTADEAGFVRQFRMSGGTLSSHCKFVHYETMGTGLLAAETIEEGELLFSIPRHMLLNLKNSILPQLCQNYEEEMLKSGSNLNMKWEDINVGWLSLMLTMMWEQFRCTEVGRQAWTIYYEVNKESKWLQVTDEEDTPVLPIEAEAERDPEGSHASIGQEYRNGGRSRGRQDWGFYFSILPKNFDTPMFWNDEDLEELRGTGIPSKIGKDEATKDYLEKVRPYIRERAHIFFGSIFDSKPLEDLIDEHYSLHQFHLMGSRILSRSFHVKDAKEGVLGEEGKEYDDRETKSDSGDDSSDDEDDEESEDIETISMVPMADMLNARSGCDNAHLFYKRDRLEMRAIQKIEKGKQIWNTYGDPPSSDLLRRYGYVDLGNAADVVEVNVQDLVNACLKLEDKEGDQDRQAALMERIQWACSLGLDEDIALTYPFPPSNEPPYLPAISAPSTKEFREAAAELPDELLIHARLLCLSDGSFIRIKEKEKLPNVRIDAVEEHSYGATERLGVAELIHQALEERKKAYKTSIEEDEAMLFNDAALSTNKRTALIVRLSEKRILVETQKVLMAAMSYVESKKREAASSNGKANKKKKM